MAFRLPFVLVVQASIGLALLTLLSKGHSQVQVVLEPSKDNTLYESAAGELSNGAGQYIFVGRTNQPSNSIRRALLAFDIAGTIPPNSTILSATLTLSMSQTTSTAHTVTLHRATADWGEGTSIASGNEGSGAPSTPGDATWIHRFFNSTFWINAGGDFAATPSASLSVDAIGTYTWGPTPEMVNDVQQWLNSPSSNFGWLMKGNEAAAPTSKRFGSRQNLTAAARPKLTITYQPPVSVDEIQGVPRRFALYQNYPNPFNPSTTITFDIAERTFVMLKVRDVVGRDVATIVNQVLEPGRYVRQVTAEGWTTGVYFYQITAGSYRQTRKLLLVR